MFDKEMRQQAAKDLEMVKDDISTSKYDDEMIEDGVCPACAGTSYMDGDYDNDDDSCDGIGNYGCDQGSLLFEDDVPLWVEIKRSDKRNEDRAKSQASFDPQTAVRRAADQMQRMDDPRMIVYTLAEDYPHLGRAQRAQIAAQATELAFG